MIGTRHLTSDDGHPMLVTGRVFMVIDKVVHRDPADPEKIVKRFRDRYVTTVATLLQHGLALIQDVDALTRFMRQFSEKIAQHRLGDLILRREWEPTQRRVN